MTAIINFKDLNSKKLHWWMTSVKLHMFLKWMRTRFNWHLNSAKFDMIIDLEPILWTETKKHQFRFWSKINCSWEILTVQRQQRWLINCYQIINAWTFSKRTVLVVREYPYQIQGNSGFQTGNLNSKLCQLFCAWLCPKAVSPTKVFIWFILEVMSREF